MKKLDSRGIAHLFLLMSFVLVFAIVGVYFLVKSKAAPAYGPEYAGYSDYQSVQPGTGIGIVTEESLVPLGVKQVAEVSAGASVTLGGKGGGNPKFIKNCYIIKPVGGNATVSLWGINTVQQVTVSPGIGDWLYQEVCVGSARKSTAFPGYSLKVDSGKVRFHHLRYHYYLLP
ncbi:hypothetical protein A3D14_00110 [Candidatus Saccharibacteria bacterium RIFCSPHIGHO2_02_FULL_47_12]|nr:MAG: hypothetical protein A3D14_00110 [Candidatus Saccharibacteria bacterium RIFCSPHIGHO2_02_FULL_47_12]